MQLLDWRSKGRNPTSEINKLGHIQGEKHVHVENIDDSTVMFGFILIATKS